MKHPIRRHVSFTAWSCTTRRAPSGGDRRPNARAGAGARFSRDRKAVSCGGGGKERLRATRSSSARGDEVGAKHGARFVYLLARCASRPGTRTGVEGSLVRDEDAWLLRPEGPIERFRCAQGRGRGGAPFETRSTSGERTEKSLELRPTMSLRDCGASRASTPRRAACSRSSMAGSPKDSIPPISGRRARCSTS